MNDRPDKAMPNDGKITAAERRFSAEAEYAESIFRSSLGEMKTCIRALEHALTLDPEYPPAILSMGSIEYQRGRKRRGKELFQSIVSLSAEAIDGGESELARIVDEAGDFLIQTENYADGLELYRAAVARFPDHAMLHQGLGCCAGHMGRHEEAVAASMAALELEPANQKFVNDLGWSLFKAGRQEEAHLALTRAVTMDPDDDLARENLRLCTEAWISPVRLHPRGA